jgi:hypothetical protein
VVAVVVALAPPTSSSAGIGVPPLGAAVEGDHAERAVYTTVNGQSDRLDTAAPNAQPYPERLARMGLEDDVRVTCGAPGNCSIAGPLRDDQFRAPALAAAVGRATSERSYPLAVVVSFRILMAPRGITDWAPSACPAPGQPASERRELERQRAIVGSCMMFPRR